MSFKGLRSWPPAWIWCYGGENIHPRGEVGVLREIVQSRIQPDDRWFLYINHEGATYIGFLLIDDPAFFTHIVKLLQDYLHHPIAEVGSLDLSYTL
jgi:hypothetical protein